MTQTTVVAGFEINYRNPNNQRFGDGKYFVARYDSGKCKFIGTYDDCEKFINERYDGDFDEYGIFEN